MTRTLKADYSIDNLQDLKKLAEYQLIAGFNDTLMKDVSDYFIKELEKEVALERETKLKEVMDKIQKAEL